MDNKQDMISTYQQIVKSDSCKICILGIEDISLAHQLINVLQYKRVLGLRNKWATDLILRDINDAITFYKSVSVSFNVFTSRQDVPYIKCKIINSFLTEQAYEHKSIKYSNIIENHPYANFDRFVRRVRYNRRSRSIRHMYPVTNDEKDEKYSSIERVNDGMLKAKHIMAADGFMVVYDVRYQESLYKIRKHLKHIFEIKGYFEIIDQLKKDEMCFFPISLIGVNLDMITDKTQMITKTQINKLAMEYCVDNERMHLFESNMNGFVNNTSVAIRDGVKAFAQIIVDYYYYRSLNDDEIYKLKFKANSKSNCLIL